MIAGPSWSDSTRQQSQYIKPAEATVLRLLFSEFGMMPASRRRVAAAAEVSGGNRFARFVTGPDE